MKKWDKPIISTLEVKETMTLALCNCSEARKTCKPDGVQGGEGQCNEHPCHKTGNGGHVGNDQGQGHKASVGCLEHDYCCCYDPNNVNHPEISNPS